MQCQEKNGRDEKTVRNICSLEGKRAIVTGGSKGIGAAIALGLAEQGADILLVARNENKLIRIKNEIEQKGRTCGYIVADLADPCKVEKVQQEISKFGNIDIYVNNAAFTIYKTPTETEDSDIEALFDTNFRASVNLVKYVAEAMIQNEKGGAILFITSINALNALPGQAVYSATKAALESIMKSFAAELGPYGIRVNSIAPGAIHTDMNPHFTPAKMAEMGQRIPLGHVGEPDEIADVAVFMCSPGARYMTGSTVVVDGGYLLRK